MDTTIEPHEDRRDWRDIKRISLGIYRAIVAASLILILSGLTLFMDRHNDERYIKNADAVAVVARVGDDRYVTREGLPEWKQTLTAKVDELAKKVDANAAESERKQEAMQKDIKDILWAVGGGSRPKEERK